MNHGKGMRVLIVESAFAGGENLPGMEVVPKDLGLRVTEVDRLEEALERLQKESFDAVLLNLRLPKDTVDGEASGRDLASERVPLLVVTSPGDSTPGPGSKPADHGAESEHRPGVFQGRRLLQAILGGLERTRVVESISEASQRDQHEKEVRRMEGISQRPGVSVTGRIYGGAPLVESEPSVFDECVREYSSILEVALEERLYTTAAPRRASLLRVLGDRLGFLRATPRDVVEVHSRGLRLQLADASRSRASAIMEEARLAVLELMGYLTAYYRRYYTGGGESRGTS